MEQTEIPAAEWESYCAGFSRAHHGWLVTLATVPTAQLQAEPEQATEHWRIIVDKVRLQRLELDAARGRCGIATDTPSGGALVEHRLDGISALFMLSVGGAHQGLRIDSLANQEQESALIWFRAPAAPEELDGIADFEM
ncbi:MAG: hypothetical protein RQ736_07640 [Thiogranum sp.]|nr:hypothetical protein [Thiogranum sp.]